MRGTPRCAMVRALSKGIIPAYAGNTGNIYSFNSSLEDHPRVCGEHEWPDESLGMLSGSSPRMRGTLHPFNVRQVSVGIIPAYAGNTGNIYSFNSSLEDHPRVCGEHEWPDESLGMLSGSSPRMRGTLHPFNVRQVSVGIIPAYAGNTRCD